MQGVHGKKRFFFSFLMMYCFLMNGKEFWISEPFK